MEETLLKYSSFYFIIIIIFCRLSSSLQQTKNRRTKYRQTDTRAHTHIHICIYFANSLKSFQCDFVGTVICTIWVNLPDTAKWKSFTRCLNGVRLHFHGTFVVCIIFVLFNGRVLCEKFFLFFFFLKMLSYHLFGMCCCKMEVCWMKHASSLFSCELIGRLDCFDFSNKIIVVSEFHGIYIKRLHERRSNICSIFS